MIKIPKKQNENNLALYTTRSGGDDRLKIKDNHDIISNAKIINIFPQLLFITLSC